MGVVVSDLKKYFETARRFDQDRVLSAQRSKRLAWSVAGLSLVAVACSGLGLAALVPLKTVQPYVVRVDNSTGIVDVITALKDGKEGYEEAVTKYFAAGYVTAREGYTAGEAERNFKQISVASTPEEQARFAAWYRGSNPESPQNIYGQTGIARVKIKSVSLVAKTVVSVRYLKTVIKAEDQKSSHWVATMTFAFVNDKMSASDRLLNPLGFVISEYRADPETLQQ